ncbi:MAG: FtsQ-type POTRA domain-containing protein [Chloroflexi bacterium]|nr:MAG: FtsQ-type POTRA domain-containing protein [Chloroflexota bacterium]
MTARRTRYRAVAGTPRRRPRVRRASARLTPTRAGAILAMLVAAGATYGLAATPALGFERLEISGAVLTPEAAVREQVAVEPGTNLVGLATQPIVERLRTLPSVADATVTVRLPDLLQVGLRERRAVVLWSVGSHRYAVDEGGVLFADLAAGAPDAVTPPDAVAALPVVLDQRVASAALGVRSVLDPVDLDAATRLASITPVQIGSHFSELSVAVTDENGFTITTGPKGWVGIFGFYGRSQRTPALIPGQVQLLTKLLAGREDTVLRVILADDRDGTYIPKPTPRPTASPKP